MTLSPTFDDALAVAHEKLSHIDLKGLSENQLSNKTAKSTSS